jgi:hypothetical protein
MKIPPIITRITKNRLNRKVYIILAAMALIMAGASVAGQTMASNPIGEMDITAGQAVTVISGSVTGVDGGRVIIDDDGFTFKAPAQVYTGDRFSINLALGNRSNCPLELEIRIEAPPGFSLDVRARDGASGAVRMGRDNWVVTLGAGEADEIEDLAITISVSDTIQPGFYNLGCVIEPLRISGGE